MLTLNSSQSSDIPEILTPIKNKCCNALGIKLSKAAVLISIQAQERVEPCVCNTVIRNDPAGVLFFLLPGNLTSQYTLQ